MRGLVGLVAVWFAFSALLFIVWTMAPVLEAVDRPSFPRDLDDLRRLADVLAMYRDAHYSYTLLLFGVAFLYKQTFAIPGSFFMNLLAGALFGGWVGSLVVCSLTALGASMCFILSTFFARPIVIRYLSVRLHAMKQKLSSERERLFLFLLSARVFPFTPHWLLNICSPFLDVPLHTHFATVGLGLIPYNVVCVRAGRVLSTIRSFHDVIDSTTLLELLGIAVFLLVVARFTKKRSGLASATDQHPTLPHVAIE